MRLEKRQEESWGGAGNIPNLAYALTSLATTLTLIAGSISPSEATQSLSQPVYPVRETYVYPVTEWVDIVREKAGNERLAKLVMEVIRFESNGYPQAKNLNSSAHGLCQVIDSTWSRYAKETEERDKWEHQLDVCFRILDNGRGIKHWPQFYDKYRIPFQLDLFLNKE